MKELGTSELITGINSGTNSSEAEFQLYNPLIPVRRFRLMELSTVRPEM